MSADTQPPTSDRHRPGGPPIKRSHTWRALGDHQRKAIIRYGIFTSVVLVLFGKVLLGMVELALSVDLHSHILLIPFVSAYLLWIRRDMLPAELRAAPGIATLFFMLTSAAWGSSALWRLEGVDYLALKAVSVVGFLIGGGFLFLGRAWMNAAAFPVTFLFFAIPLPDALVHALETGSRLASSEAADLFFSMAGASYVRDGTTFALPGITLEVAQECSGIRSSLVLLITGVFASNLLLKTTWRRWVLVLVVVPLGIMRNGFRILTLGLLCIHVGPHMVHSVIHHRGGPVFFILAQIPLVAIVWWLRRGERCPAASQANEQCSVG